MTTNHGNLSFVEEEKNPDSNIPSEDEKELKTTNNEVECISKTGDSGSVSISIPQCLPTTEKEDKLIPLSIAKKFEEISLRTKNNYQIIKKGKFAQRLKICFWISLILLYLAFLIAVTIIPSRKEAVNYWCEGDGFLYVISGCLGIGLLYFKILKVYCGGFIVAALQPHVNRINNFKQKRLLSFAFYGVFVGIFVFFLIIDSAGDRSRLISALGAVVLLLIGALYSSHPSKIRIRQIFWGTGLQVIFGILILWSPAGKLLFQCLGDKTVTFLGFTDVGTKFSFGDKLAAMHAYVFSILPVIIFFGMVLSMLYFYGIVQWVIIKLGWLMEVTMGTTPCESLAAAANIFLGQSEAPLIIRPYLPSLTKSELHSVMTGGYATVAGGVLAAYISFGINAGHLLSASVMSAPAALAFSKLICPETENSKTKSGNITIIRGEEKNVLQAAMTGILSALPLIANITGCLIGFLALTAWLNSMLDWGCQLLDYDEGTCEIQGVIGFILTPVAWLMGVPWEDCRAVGYILGVKFIVNEFIAYQQLAEFFNKGLLSPRSKVITTYALCGFSSVASMGCQIGALGSLAPSQQNTISKIAWRALIAGSLACYLTACIAGALIKESSVRLPVFNGTSI